MHCKPLAYFSIDLPGLIAQAALALGGFIVDIVIAAKTAVGIVAADITPDPMDASGAIAATELAAGQDDLLSFVLLFHDNVSFVLFGSGNSVQ